MSGELTDERWRIMLDQGGPSRDGGRTRRAIAPSLLLLTLSAGFAAGEEPIPPGTLSGRVVDPDGLPVAGARVATTAYDAGTRETRVEMEARTDEWGRFRIGPVTPYYAHRADFTVEAAGFALGTIPGGSATVYPGRDHDLGDVRLDRGRVFGGFVVDELGRPRPDAEVSVQVYRHIQGHTVTGVGPDLTLKTDAAGRFQTPPLPVGRVSVFIRMPDYRTTSASALIRPGGEEELPPIVLARDEPVPGVVRDEDGRPIAGAKIGGTAGHTATTDEAGRFLLRGFGPNSSFQLNVSRFGYASKIGRVTRGEQGYRYTAEADKVGPIVVVTLRRIGTVEGRAVDAATGLPVAPKFALLFRVFRGPDGGTTLTPVPGMTEELAQDHFQLSYADPAEYRLVLKAPGYRDAEVELPRVERLEQIDGVVARMEPGPPIPPPSLARQKIVGTATRDGVPVATGWATIQRQRRVVSNAINAPVKHGRLVEQTAISTVAAPIRDGKFELICPTPGEQLFVLVDEPSRPATQVGPFALAAGEEKRLDIACGPAGQVRGSVGGIPFEWEGHGWVVAFTRSGIVRDARVRPGGDFALDDLPPGEYGLKVGHDAYEDPETFPGDLIRQFPDAARLDANPWKTARVVQVAAGQAVEGVSLDWPE